MSSNLKISLFLLRIGVFIVMFFWTLDKFVRPEHAAAVYEKFYFIPSAQGVMLAAGVLEMIALLGFLVGFQKRFTYGFVLVIHFVSTVSAYRQYLSPFESVNLLFFAAWPMLAACVALFLLREEDTLLTIHL